MHWHQAVRFILLGGIGFTSSQGFAFVYHQNTQLKSATQLTQKQIIHTGLRAPEQANFKSAIGQNLFIQRDQKTGTPRVLWGYFKSPSQPLVTSQDYIRYSLELIGSQPNVFGIHPADLRLVDEALYLGKEVGFLKFRVYRDGVLVKDANVDFRFSHGKLVQIINQTFAEASVNLGENNEADLEGAVSNLVSGAAQFTRGDDIYRVIEQKQGYTLTKVAQFEIREGHGSFHLELDTKSAKVHEFSDNRFYVSGQAKADIHPRWWNEPLTSTGLGFLNITTAQGDILTTASGTFDAADNANPSINGLRGSIVSIHDEANSPVSRTATLANGLWSLNIEKQGTEQGWSDKSIAQSMAFFHTNAIVAEAKRFITTGWFNQSLTANVNLSSTCNAFWDGSTINMFSAGNNCANTANISDVIYHEWGHGLDANTGGIEDGAFSEGFGDIMSLVMTHSNILGIGFRVADQSAVRDLAPIKIYPRDRGEAHGEGLIIGSTFWELWTTFKEKYGEEKASEMLKNYAFKMILTARTYLDVYNALLVIDDNDGDLANGTPNLCLLNKAFKNHGLATEDLRCGFVKFQDVIFDDAGGDHDGVLEPNEQVNVNVNLKNLTPNPTASLNGEFSVDEAGITLPQDKLAWAPIAPGAESLSSKIVDMRIGDVACGTTVSAKIHIFSDNNDLVITRDFTLGKNQGQETLFQAANLPIPIPDLQSVTSAITAEGQWPDDVRLATIKAKFDIRHTYIGDISVKLTSPGGVTKEIFRGSGNSHDAHFDQDITELFANEKVKGAWVLTVADVSAQDAGFLDSFSLNITPANYICD